MKAGTIVRLSDGREGTVVYHGLDGYGIKWGRHSVTLGDIGGGNPFSNEPVPDDFQWAPEAMLRDPWKGSDLPCVGREFDIVEYPED